MKKRDGERGDLKQRQEDPVWVRLAEDEIFGNITQCLCLAKMQLSTLYGVNPEQARRQIGEASLLIGKAVRDLRKLVKQFKTCQT